MYEVTVPNEIESLRAELKDAQRERMLLTAQMKQITGERNALRAELRHTEELIEAARLKSALVDDLQAEVAALQHELNLEKAARAAIEQSRSWRLIVLLRHFVDRVRGRH